jgi:hypothetical protein
MTFKTNRTDHCRLCGKALRFGGLSTRVAGALLSPLCTNCEPRCTADPDRVTVEHPQTASEHCGSSSVLVKRWLKSL